MPYLADLIHAIEHEIDVANVEREGDALPALPQLHIRILGQSALLSNPEFSSKVTINQTRDLDALIQGDWSMRAILKRAVGKVGLVYDDLSNEAWIPENSKFIEVHKSAVLKIDLLEPFYVLLSKAVRAPEKNRNLILQGFALYGERLVQEIKRNGGDPNYFLESNK